MQACLKVGRSLLWSIVLLAFAFPTITRADDSLALSPSEISAIHQQLQSTDPATLDVAFTNLSSLPKVPDSLVPDLLKLDLSFYQSFKVPVHVPTNDAEFQALKVHELEVVRIGLLSQKIDDLLPKMDPNVLAENLRPYLKDPATRMGLIEVPSKDLKVIPLLIPELTGALDDKDENVIYWSTTALAKLGPDGASAVPRLVHLFDDQRDKVREEAGRTLIKIGATDPSYAPIFVKGLSDSDFGFEMSCQEVLSKMKFDPATVVPGLIDALDHLTSHTAIDFLVQIGPQVIPALREHAANDTYENLFSHIDVLERLGPQSATALASDLHSTNANLRYLALTLACKFSTPVQRKLDWLTPYLTDSDKHICNLALAAWVNRQMDLSAKLDLLRKDIDDPDLQDTAIDLAGDMKADAVPLLPLIHAMIDKSDDKTKIPYMFDVLEINPKDRITYGKLIEYLKNSNEDVVDEAVFCLVSDELTERSKDAIKQLHDDPNTSESIRQFIENCQKHPTH